MEEQSPRNVHRRPPKAASAPAYRPVVRYLLIIAAAILVAAALFLAFRSCSPEGEARDPNAALGQLEGKSPEELQAELDRVVKEGMFNISIATFVEFADGTSEGELRIENVPRNHYLMKVVVSRDDTGEAVYTSGLIEPNHHIQKAKLDVPLEAGTYPCTAVFYAYDAQTEELVGQAAAKLSIAVLN